MSAPESQLRLDACAQCGDVTVQTDAWVDCNSGEPDGGEGPRGAFWCPTCEVDGADVEKFEVHYHSNGVPYGRDHWGREIDLHPVEYVRADAWDTPRDVLVRFMRDMQEWDPDVTTAEEMLDNLRAQAGAVL